MGCERSGMTPNVLARATRRMKPPLTETGKAAESSVRGGKGEAHWVYYTTVFMSHPNRGADLAAGLTSLRVKREEWAGNRTLTILTVFR